jgi:cobalamin biosynthesis Mg chelatase CobN
MEPINLLPRNFTNLLREDAGMSFMEFALLGSLVVVMCLLLLFAARRSA